MLEGFSIARRGAPFGGRREERLAVEQQRLGLLAVPQAEQAASQDALRRGDAPVADRVNLLEDLQGLPRSRLGNREVTARRLEVRQGCQRRPEIGVARACALAQDL